MFKKPETENDTILALSEEERNLICCALDVLQSQVREISNKYEKSNQYLQLHRRYNEIATLADKVSARKISKEGEENANPF